MNYLSVNFSLKADIAETATAMALEIFEMFSDCSQVKNMSVIHTYFQLLASL